LILVNYKIILLSKIISKALKLSAFFLFLRKFFKLKTKIMIQKFTFIILFIFTTSFLNAQIINESFEGAWSPNPSGWYQEELDGGSGSGSNQYWQKSTYDGSWTPSPSGENGPNNVPDGSSVAWYNNYDATEGQIDQLYTVDIDLSATTNPTVSFYAYYENGGSIDFFLIASKNGGTTWDTISSTMPETGTSWKQYTYHLPEEYKVANARFGFQITTNGNFYDVWLDNIILFGFI